MGILRYSHTVSWFKITRKVKK